MIAPPQGPFNYTLSMYVPRYSRTWLHPYMSVVLGITASVILCLLMTLCRRIMQRYGWVPFRPRPGDGPDGQDGNVSRVQVRGCYDGGGEDRSKTGRGGPLKANHLEPPLTFRGAT